METMPDVRVIILTASTSEDAIIEAVSAGATGYLQKFSGRGRLLSTIRDVAAGELRVSRRHREKGVRRDTRRGASGSRSKVSGPDEEGTGDTHAILPGSVIRADSGGQGQQNPLPFGIPYTALRISWALTPSRRLWSGPCETACWTTIPPTVESAWLPSGVPKQIAASSIPPYRGRWIRNRRQTRSSGRPSAL